MIRKKTIIKTISVTLLINLLIAFSFTSADNLSCNSMWLLLNANLNKISELKNIKDMSKNFCTYVSESKCENIVNDYSSDYFDANQSIFLTLLCDNVWECKNFTSITRTWNESVLKKTSFSDFNIHSYGPNDIDYCDSKANMNWCDFSKHLPKIFNEIISDYFNVIQAKVYGIDWFQSRFKPAEFANKFSEKNYLIDICNPDNKKYYKETCTYLSNYMKQANKLLTKTKIIDVKKISEQNKDFDCNNNFSENILYCGLFWNEGSYSSNFINLIYNEYFWYRLFMEYYSTSLLRNPNLSNINSTSNAEKIADNKEKVIWIQQNNTRIRIALSDSLRTLSEISQTFPLHIWLTMYQENANLFMKELSKIYPPIRTLADKLRNVQRAE